MGFECLKFIPKETVRHGGGKGNGDKHIGRQSLGHSRDCHQQIKNTPRNQCIQCSNQTVFANLKKENFLRKQSQFIREKEGKTG